MKYCIIPTYDKSIMDYLDKTLGANCHPNIRLLEDNNAYNKFIDDMRAERIILPYAYIIPQSIVSNVIDDENSNRERHGIWRVRGNEREVIVDLKYELCFLSKVKEERETLFSCLSDLFKSTQYFDVVIPSNNGIDRKVKIGLDKESEINLQQGAPRGYPLFQLRMLFVAHGCAIPTYVAGDTGLNNNLIDDNNLEATYAIDIEKLTQDNKNKLLECYHSLLDSQNDD